MARRKPEYDIVHTYLIEERELPFDRHRSLTPMAAEIVSALARAFTGFDLLRLCSVGTVDEGMQHLDSALKKKKTKISLRQFEEACIRMTKDEWHVVSLKHSHVLRVLANLRPATVDLLVQWQWNCPYALDTVEFWNGQVSAAIAAKDWIAGWDAARFALLGVPGDDQLVPAQLGEWSPWKTCDRLQEGRVLFCSLANARHFIMKVYEAMVADGILVAPTQEPPLLDRKAARPSDQCWIPGILEMTPFLTRAKPGSEWPLKVDMVGDMVMRIAAAVEQLRAVMPPPKARRSTKKKMAMTEAAVTAS